MRRAVRTVQMLVQLLPAQERTNLKLKPACATPHAVTLVTQIHTCIKIICLFLTPELNVLDNLKEPCGCTCKTKAAQCIPTTMTPGCCSVPRCQCSNCSALLCALSCLHTQVKSIAEMGAYVALLEYNGIEGMILLSELSRRRIRSITKLIKVSRVADDMLIGTADQKQAT